MRSKENPTMVRDYILVSIENNLLRRNHNIFLTQLTFSPISVRSIALNPLPLSNNNPL